MLVLFLKGGPVMYTLLFCSMVAATIIIERFFAISIAKINTKKFINKLQDALSEYDIKKAKEICEKSKGPIASILRAGLRKYKRGRDEMEKAISHIGSREIASLERGLLVINTISKIAPLLGFLGTVTGMIKAFEAIVKYGLGDPTKFAAGISEAMVTTAAGLIVAIPAMTFYFYFMVKIDRLVLDMEENSTYLLDVMEEVEEQQLSNA